MLTSLQGNIYPYPYIYPQAAQLASLIQPAAKHIHRAKIWHEYQQADYKPVAHPSFLDGMDTEQMFKIFKFGTWAQKMVDMGKFEALSDVIKAELQVFENRGFPSRKNFQVRKKYTIVGMKCHNNHILLQEPKFSDIVVSGSNQELMDSMKGSLTDNGLCTTINSKSILATFNMDNDRIRSFENMLSKRPAKDVSSRIKGSGYLQRSSFWLNSRSSSYAHGSAKGKIIAAINNWNEYFSVRWSYFHALMNWVFKIFAFQVT